jgi:hypothetical protein
VLSPYARRIRRGAALLCCLAGCGGGGETALDLRVERDGRTAEHALRCDDGETSGWPDAEACERLTDAADELTSPLGAETRDLQITPYAVTVSGELDGEAVSFEWRGEGSGTRATRLAAWRRALGEAAFADLLERLG